MGKLAAIDRLSLRSLSHSFTLDSNIYVRSARAGARVLASISRFITQGLKLLRIPVIPATQSGAKLPPNPKEACHPIRTKAAPHRSPIGAQRRLG